MECQVLLAAEHVHRSVYLNIIGDGQAEDVGTVGRGEERGMGSHVEVCSEALLGWCL